MLTGAAHAGTRPFDATVPSGKSIVIATMQLDTNGDCTRIPGGVDIRLGTKPNHGTIGLATIKCSGGKGSTIGITYTSRPGYKGTDFFQGYATAPNGQGPSFRTRLLVQ